MASPTDPKESVSSKSFSPPSYGAEDVNLATLHDQVGASIVVESGPLSPLPPPDGLSPLPLGQEDTSMPTDDEDDDDDDEDVVEPSDDEGGGDNEDDDESEHLDAAVLPAEYLVPIKGPEEDHAALPGVRQRLQA